MIINKMPDGEKTKLLIHVYQCITFCHRSDFVPNSEESGTQNAFRVETGRPTPHARHCLYGNAALPHFSGEPVTSQCEPPYP